MTAVGQNRKQAIQKVSFCSAPIPVVRMPPGLMSEFDPQRTPQGQPGSAVSGGNATSLPRFWSPALRWQPSFWCKLNKGGCPRAFVCWEASHQGATGQFSGFMGVASQPRPRGIAVSRTCILIVDGGGATDTPTSLHRALLVRSGRAVGVAGEVADL